MIFVVAQIIGIIAWIFFLLSYFGKNVNKVIFLQLISSIFYCLNYFLLGAWTGLFISIFEGVREFCTYRTDKDKYIFYLTAPIYVLIAFLSDSTILLIVPIVASLIDGYSILKSKKAIVIAGVISNTLWIIYDLYYLDYVVAFTDFLLVLANLSILLYGYSKFLRRSNVHVVNRKVVTTDTLKTIYKLDKDYYDDKYCWSLAKIKELYKKEKNSYILIKDGSKVIGYINILNIKKDVYDKMINSEDMHDDFIPDDIINYDKKNAKYYLNLNSIVLKNEYQNSDSSQKMLNGLKKYLKTMEKKGYIIKKINSYAVNDFERLILEKFGFEKEKSINNECELYSIVF